MPLGVPSGSGWVYMESVSVPQGSRYEVHILLNQNTLFSFFVLGVRNLKDLNPSPLAIYLNCGRKTLGEHDHVSALSLIHSNLPPL